MPEILPAAPPRRPLEPTGEDLRLLLSTAAEYVARVVDGLPDAPASDLDGVHALLADEALSRPPGAAGRPLTELLDIVDRAAAKGFNPSSAGYLAFIPGSGLVSAAVADLVADVLNRYTGIAFPAPGLVAIEAHLLRWVADLFGMPAGAATTLTTGASLATLSAVITARSERLPRNFLDGTVYVTEQAHRCVAKAVRLAGFPPDAVRAVAVDADLRMDPDALRAAVAADRAAGRTPFLVCANAGSINTGEIDPLPAIADVAAAVGLWLHVDGAYGGFFQLTERGRERLRGIERADSLVLDPHKGLFLPFGTGCLVVRDGAALRRAHGDAGSHYLQDIGDLGLPNYNDHGPELTRDYRGLRMWLPLHLHGVDAFRAALDEKLDLAEHVYRELAKSAHLSLLGPPRLSTVAFQLRDAHSDATAELLRRVNAEQRVLMSSTRIDGRHVGRICVLNHRTDRARIDEAVEAIVRHAAALHGAGVP